MADSRKIQKSTGSHRQSVTPTRPAGRPILKFANQYFVGDTLAIIICPAHNGKMFAVTIDKEDLERVLSGAKRWNFRQAHEHRTDFRGRTGKHGRNYGRTSWQRRSGRPDRVSACRGPYGPCIGAVMNDFETLEELREMVRYAKQDVEDWASRVDEARRAYDTRFQTLRKAEERYVAHLEMMAAGVKQ